MQYDLLIKQDIFNMFEVTRILFNNYYNGHDGNYTNEEIEQIQKYIEHLKMLIDDIEKEF